MLKRSLHLRLNLIPHDKLLPSTSLYRLNFETISSVFVFVQIGFIVFIQVNLQYTRIHVQEAT